LEAWQAEGNRGIASVVTGGGKTIFALACAKVIQPVTALVVVPTQALLDQWWEEVADFFNLSFDEINLVTGRKRIHSGTFNLAVINTAAAFADRQSCENLFLIVDECHKAASEKYRSLFKLKRVASLGLSATPERPYDDGLKEVLQPELGPVIYNYTYRDALADGVIVPFTLVNVVFDLEPERQEEFNKLTKRIAVSMARYGPDAQETISLLLKRARTVNMSLSRVELAVRLVAKHRGARIIVFHEDIAACEVLYQAISGIGIKCRVYHSQRGVRERATILAGFRKGEFDVLVTCRALDEGFNVPESEIGIIAASTATRRQRIQRLGRLVRPSAGKRSAMVYTLVATDGEIARLQQEELDLEGVAETEWRKA
jgi:superfamily II DNA or RNA helicase